MDELEANLVRMLKRSDARTGDEGFTESVMASLPRRRFAGARARRWTLAMAATGGALFTAVLAAPLDRAIDRIAPGTEAGMWLVVVFASVLVALPTLWSLWNAHE